MGKLWLIPAWGKVGIFSRASPSLQGLAGCGPLTAPVTHELRMVPTFLNGLREKMRRKL